MDSRRLWAPGLPTRVIEYMAQGTDPEQYLVSTAKLREVIMAAPANRPLKRRLIKFLDDKLLAGKTDVPCYRVRYLIAEFAETTDDEDLIKIGDDVRDLDKLPFSLVNGQRVN